MPERSTLFQFVQIAAEDPALPGAKPPDADFRKLQTMAFELQPNQEFIEIRGAAFKFPVGYVINKDFTTVTVPAMPISYNEIHYIFNSALCTGAIATATGASTHTFSPSSTQGDVFTTFWIQQGDPLKAHEMGYAVLNGFDLEFSRDGVTIAAEGFGRKLEITGVSMATTGVTTPPLEPVLPSTLDVILADTAAALSTPANKALRVAGGTIHVANRQMALWTVDSAEESYAAVYESPPEATMELHLEADDEGLEWITLARAGDTKFFRLLATGPLIGAGPATYKIQIDLAVQVNEAVQFEDTDGLYNVAVNASVVHDATWGKGMTAVVVNEMAAL